MSKHYEVEELYSIAENDPTVSQDARALINGFLNEIVHVCMNDLYLAGPSVDPYDKPEPAMAVHIDRGSHRRLPSRQGRHRMIDLTEAVEAAARAWWETSSRTRTLGWRRLTRFRDALRQSLEVVAPIIAAQVWDDGHVAGLNNALQHEGGEFIDNPYTSEEPL